MAIDFKQFKQPTSKTSASSSKDERPKAEFWLNIGYPVDVETSEGTEARFVSLPVGIPVDTMEKLSVKSSNEEFSALQSARNDLLDQIMEAAQKLNSGEEVTLNLELRLRRINADKPAISPENNPFVRRVI